ncbi:hypothetical protein CBR_g59385 [Chara braunii]|uniref:Retrotransposon gag domain-containing protein n=1 Tax=Chara braunii TaxID=69332 RepID=A0A388MEX9_CHABU|nr:hypothetical protein CBR_g59385 [Chara braunii]|eukprot:GBG93128.1 hypothetical protein CBR_g59385 [Chara braunii]
MRQDPVAVSEDEMGDPSNETQRDPVHAEELASNTDVIVTEEDIGFRITHPRSPAPVVGTEEETEFGGPGPLRQAQTRCTPAGAPVHSTGVGLEDGEAQREPPPHTSDGVLEEGEVVPTPTCGKDGEDERPPTDHHVGLDSFPVLSSSQTSTTTAPVLLSQSALPLPPHYQPPHYVPQFRPDRLPTFDGKASELQLWITTSEEQLRYHGVHMDLWPVEMSSRFTGRAASTWRDFLALRAQRGVQQSMSYPEFRDFLQQYFSRPVPTREKKIQALGGKEKPGDNPNRERL